jgi:hypothetical protein
LSHDILRVVLGIGALAWGLPLAACGDFSADPVGQSGSGNAPMAGSPGSSGSGGSSVAGGGGGGAGGTTTVGGSGGSGPRPEPPEPTCTDVAACGGDVAGVWFASGSCLPLTGMADISDFGLGCKEVAAKGKLDVTGNWTLGADGKISDNTSTTGEVEMELAAECLNISGTVTQCDRVPAQLESIGLKEVTCVNSTVTTGGCTCKGKIEQMGSMAHVTFDTLKMGTYMTAANKLSTMGIDSVEYDYCVAGDIMTVTPKVSKDIGQMNGTVVFQKQ